MIDNILLTRDFWLDMFEQRVEKFCHDTYILLFIDVEWKKLVQYYKKAYQTPSYIAAIVLNLFKKWSYFKD